MRQAVRTQPPHWSLRPGQPETWLIGPLCLDGGADNLIADYLA
jgi:hypothetical protein